MILSAIKQMEAFARTHPEVVSLSQGIPSLPTDKLIRNAVNNAIQEGKVDTYSDPAGIFALRKLISQRLLTDSLLYDPTEIMVTAGAIEALSATFLALIQPGDEVIIPSPSYAAYTRVAQLSHASIKHVVLDEDQNWKLPVKVLEKMITPKTKAILLCNPNNPTGSIYSNEELYALCHLAKEYQFYIILDDVYQNIYFAEKPSLTFARDEAFRKQLIRIVSLSKDFAMSGWRIGYLFSDQEVIEKILPVHDTLINCAPVVSQYAALTALQQEQKIVPFAREFYLKQRQLMGMYLEELNEYLTFSYPQGAYFFFPRIKGMTNSQQFCLDLVQKEKVAVVPGSDFGEGGEGHIRLCFGRSEEAIHEGMNRLGRYLKSQ